MVQSFGKVTVTTGGTPTRATANLGTPTHSVHLQSLLVQALPANTGLVYISFRRGGASPGDDRTNRVYTLAILPAPASGTTGPFASASFSIPLAQQALDLSEIWIDVSVNGEGVIISGTHNRDEPYA